LIVSTNDWLLGATPEQTDWISRNSIQVDVKEKCGLKVHSCISWTERRTLKLTIMASIDFLAE